MIKKNFGFLLLLIASLPLFVLAWKNPLKFDSSANVKADQIMSNCGGASNCHGEEFKKIAKENDLDYTLEVLDQFLLRTKTSGCHFLAHVISAEEINKDSNNWMNKISEPPLEKCTGGFIMGALEAHKKSDKSFQINTSSISDICEFIETKKKNSLQTCIHSMGHLILVEENGNVAEANRFCNGLFQNLRYECHAGVFMENIFRRNLLSMEIGEPINWDDQTILSLEKLCGSYSEPASNACWREMSHIYVDSTGRSSEKFNALCDRASTEMGQKDCRKHAEDIVSLLSKH